MTAVIPPTTTRRGRSDRTESVPDAEFGYDGAEFVRQPPHNVEAERAVLGALLMSKDAVADVVEILPPNQFYRPAHEAIYAAVCDLYAQGEPADPITVADALDRAGELKRVGGPAYLLTLTETVTTAANATYYAEIVADKAALRRLAEACTRGVQMAYTGADGCDAAEIVDRAQSEVNKVTSKRNSQDAVSIEDLLQPTMDELDAIAKRGGISMGVPTGFTDLDKHIQGLHPGQLVIVAARPGVGKALALDTVLPTPGGGQTTMAEVCEGDLLLDAHGEPTRVVRTTEVMHDRLCYEVEFDEKLPDGSPVVIVADAQHQWHTIYAPYSHSPGAPGVRTTKAIAATLHQLDVAHAPAHKVVDQLSSRRGKPARRIVAVRRVPSVAVRCVEVSGRDHLYLAGPTGIPTHNSTLGSDFLRSASIKHGQAGVLFSLEMSKTEIVMKMLSAETGIKLDTMRNGEMTQEQWGDLAARMEEIRQAPLFIDDSSDMTMMEIRAKARRLRQRHDLKLIVVDYLQLLTSGKRVESRQVEVAEFSRNFKLMAKELEVPVVALSQLNRGPEQRSDRRPMMSDLRESGALEQDADLIMLLDRPAAIAPDHPRAGEIDVHIPKFRQGRPGVVTLADQLHLGRFYDLYRG
ncbi:replicative DNA helicase [Nocardia suismassiliense]|uniref:replicative DNA helicase n=1 Tax=Nocardia suismassiliense TaxID=2077092 RepID=UPI000D1F6FD3|nr:replicative DNA helicase [Nocardia suismassiliense]